MTYRELIAQTEKDLGVSQVGKLKQQSDFGTVAYLGRKNEIVFPFAPPSGLYPIYLDADDDTVVEHEVIQAIYRKFGDRSEMNLGNLQGLGAEREQDESHARPETRSEGRHARKAGSRPVAAPTTENRRAARCPE